MKLTLQLHSSPQGPIRAAFLRGNDPQRWLSSLQSWDIPLSELEAYAVPQSKSNLQVAGLLLIHHQGHFPAQLDFQEAYRCVAQALIIPQYASIQPQVAEEEWKNLLFYDWHFYHPGIGMVGFQHSDRVQLSDLLRYPAATQQDWSLAQPGPSPDPPLRQISVQPSTVQEMFANVESVGDKSLKDLLKNVPKDDNESDDLRLTLLNGLDNLLNKRPKLQDGESQSLLGKWLDQLQQHILQNIEDLRKQRDDEINRLLKLFQDDPDEALRYSIPLNSPYEGRGIAPPSGQLGRKDPLDFNLGGLGGGAARDNWELDAARRAALHQHYLKVANQKIAEGDFRKAAYIHAHLLGDFHTAAKVLEQGKHYHEAAQLYLDHLKNPAQAARCFEQAGLYSAAIPIYLELGEHEKAGDLYALIDQWDEAEKLYQDCAGQALQKLNYLEAARILQNKLKDDEQAKMVLLNGFRANVNPFACLNRYFDFYHDVSNEELDQEVKSIYKNEVTSLQHHAFMETLREIGKIEARRGALPLTRDIVYTVVSKELLADQLSHLSMLNTFVPHDRLLQNDTSRFSAEVKARQVVKKIKNSPFPALSKKAQLVMEINLNKEVQWREARILNHVLLVLGKMEKSIYLNCSDLEERSDFVVAGQSNTRNNHRIFALPHHSPYLSITQSDYLSLSAIRFIEDFFGNKLFKFNAIFPETVIAIAAVNQEKIAKLKLGLDGSVTLEYCKPNGEILESVLCTDEVGNEFWLTPFSADTPLIMHFRNGYFYFVIPSQALLIRIDREGKTALEHLAFPALKIAAGDENTAMRIVVSVGDPGTWGAYGCYYFRPTVNGFQACGEVFEFGVEVENLLFTTTGLIVTEQNQVRIYDTRGNATPRKVGDFEVDGQIIDAFAGPVANQVGFLTNEEKVLFYEINELDS